MSYEYYFICNNLYLGKVVHHKDCRYLRNNQKKFLGSFPDYAYAVATAMKISPEADQCQACQEQQHKTDAALRTTTMKNVLKPDSRAKARQPEKPAPDLKATAYYINRVPRKHS